VSFTAAAAVPLIAAAMHDGPTHVAAAIARCDDLLVEAETPVWQSFVLPPLAGLHAMAGRFGLARELLARARGQRREFADRGTIVTSWSWYAASVELLAGMPAKAEQILAEAITTLRSTTNREWLAANLALLAEALYLQGRYEESLGASSEALATASSDHLYAVARASSVHAKSLARTGNAGEAEAVVLAGMERLSTTDALGERARASAAAAEVFAVAGADQDARDHREEALELFAEKGDVASAAALAGSPS
jgi:tetratricopeptide (TPR) repeat protein